MVRLHGVVDQQVPPFVDAQLAHVARVVYRFVVAGEARDFALPQPGDKAPPKKTPRR